MNWGGGSLDETHSQELIRKLDGFIYIAMENSASVVRPLYFGSPRDRIKGKDRSMVARAGFVIRVFPKY